MQSSSCWHRMSGQEKISKFLLLIIGTCLGVAIAYPWVYFTRQTEVLRPSDTYSSSELQGISPCEGWVPFHNEKCFKIINSDANNTQEEAEAMCEHLSIDFKHNAHSKLISIKTLREQKFLEHFLFVENKIVGNVWLGLKAISNNSLEWNDGTGVVYSNWGNQSDGAREEQCVEMQPGKSTFWFRTNCEQSNVIVCEKMQVHSLEALHTMLLNLELQREKDRQDILQQINNQISYSVHEINCTADMDIVDTLISEITVLQEENKEIRMQLSALENNMSVMELKDSKAGRKIGEIEKDVEHSRQKIGNLSEMSEVSITAIRLLEVNNEETKTNISSLQEKNDQSLKSIIDLERNKEEMEKKIEEFDLQHVKVVDAITVLERFKNDSENKIDQIEKESVNVSIVLKRHEEDGENKITELETKNAEASNAIRALESTWENVTKKMIELEAKNEIARKSVLGLERNMREELDELMKEIVTSVNGMTSLERNITETRRKIDALESASSLTAVQVTAIKQNPVPVGFIYVQLPGTQPPATLWPQTNWKEVSSDYAGLFFRVEGGNSAPFGTLQEDNTRRLAQAYFVGGQPRTDPMIPKDGSWSTYAFTGKDSGGSDVGLRFRLTTGEVRPRNKSVKLWQRIG